MMVNQKFMSLSFYIDFHIVVSLLNRLQSLTGHKSEQHFQYSTLKVPPHLAVSLIFYTCWYFYRAKIHTEQNHQP